MPWITHLLFMDLIDNFHAKKTKSFREKVCCVQPLCELQLFAALDANDIRHHPNLELMSISLLHFTAFFQGEDKSIERGENLYNWGHVESFRYADGEIVGLVHASRRERDGKYETCSLSHCVLSTAFN